MKTTFDATKDFIEPGVLEGEIEDALIGHNVNEAIALIVSADGLCNEFVSGESEFSCEVQADDWVIFTGPGRENLVEFFATELRNKL